ncbi:glycoside hydrolase domain-containing protein [Saccharomonospora cyanea]|uniref:exo-alpha-sialidase n=1 Tax=Saccharomonospora cyanea NA-134 TaxID=882082 RepID=H5XGL8_9PSEU|nr:glycoside hydrolase domain-containing protein [Saccharomonospora cyanea]EHR60557.1 putative carbohydrate binding protein,alpha-galactosidase family protein,BNR/Asp-box repeat protein [Saccharomonospora cyanea NA-134]
MKRSILALTAVASLALGLLTPAAADPAEPTLPERSTAPAATSTGTTTSGGLPVTDLASRYGGSHPRYRIPALTTLPNGDLLAVYDGRPTMADLPSNIALLMRRSTDGGRTWGPQRVIRQDPAPNGYGDPSLLVDRETGRVFVFHAASINRGFGDSETGNDPSNPDILHPDYSYSDDNGRTWQHRRITAMLKNPAWGGMFAASGEGIQLRRGAHAGRLIQQYTVRFNGKNYAVSAYSDDHGETWQAGELVGPGADENKTVELSDGRVLLNSRAAPYRRTAVSEDGGETYTPFEQDTELVDPANNGSVIRAFPDAEPGDPRAEWLLFSNTEDSGIRRNLTVKLSCDDGETWPVRKVVEHGAAAYSTLTPLGDGSSDDALGGEYGLFFEREGYRHLSFTRFDLDWLEGACAPVTVETEGALPAGTSSELSVTVSNQSERTLPAGKVTLDAKDGWSARPVTVPALGPGQSRTVTLSVTPADEVAAGRHELSVRYAVTGASSSARATVSVDNPSPPARADLDVLPVLDAVHTMGADGLLGDEIAPWIRVTNTGNVPLTSVRVTGPDNSASCDHAGPLAPGDSYVCKSVRHTVTEADLAAGEWAPEFRARADGPGGAVADRTVAMEPVDLSEPAPPEAATSVWVPSGAFEASSFVRVPRVGGQGQPLAADRTLRLQVPVAGRASAQLAVTAPHGAENLQVFVSRLRGPGRPLPPNAVTVRYPQYVPDEVHGGVVADPLREADTVDVAEGRNQAAWITVEIPAGTAPGAYTGSVVVRDADGELGRWPLRVDVPDFALRDMADRPFVLDLWAHPDAVADHLGAEPWSEAHWRGLRPYLEDLADHGQRVVDVAITEDPWMVQHEGEWRAQTQSSYRSAVEWRWDGSTFSFDYTAFDRYVEESRKAGIDGSIHAFAMLQFRGPELLNYTDTRTGERVREEVSLGGARYREAWTAFLRDFRAHLEEKGWFDRTRLAFDERPAATMEVAFDVIAEADPAWSDRIALAANSLAEADLSEFVSFNYSFLDDVPDELIQRRRADGKPTLYYTYYEPRRPNTVTASPPVSTRALGWVVEQRDLDGYLRWTYNSWPKDVYRDPSFRYGQGDEYLVYPGDDGPVSSVRWEVFRDGQDDAEVLDLARTELGEDSAVLRAALDGVDADAQDGPATWARMLQQRANVTDALGSHGARIAVDAPDGSVAYGSAAEFEVTVTATGEALDDVELTLPAWPSESVEITVPESTDVAAGESRTWRVRVDVPSEARNLAVVAGDVLADGDRVGSFTWVPTVGAPVAADGPITVDRAGSPDATAPVTVSVPVRNASATPATVRLDLTGLDFWRVEPADLEVELAPRSTTKVTVPLHPDGRTGWSTVTASLSFEGEQLSGPTTFDLVSGGVHVSDLAWSDEVNGWGPIERDRSNGEDEAGDGATMSIAGRTYSKGVGAHAVSGLTVDLDGGCSRLITDYGIDDEIGGAARVVFEVVGDGRVLWTSDAVTPASRRQYVEVDVTGVDQLRLVVEDGGNGVGQDHADWAGAWLACARPPAALEPAG